MEWQERSLAILAGTSLAREWQERSLAILAGTSLASIRRASHVAVDGLQRRPEDLPLLLLRYRLVSLTHLAERNPALKL